jgi:hypothetical protein
MTLEPLLAARRRRQALNLAAQQGPGTVARDEEDA